MTADAYIPCVHFSAGDNLPPTRIVIHGTVGPTRAGAARGVAAYFQEQASGGSAQLVVDPKETIRCAQDNTICWHAPPNKGSLGIEFCDWVSWRQGNNQTVADLDPFWHGKTEADFNARWSLPDWDDMLKRGASEVAAWMQTYGIPLVRLSPADLLAGQRGLCGHIDVSQAWHQTDHTDGASYNFAWDTFLKYVAADLGAPAPAPAPHPAPAPAPAPSPTAHPLAVDGAMGPATITRWQQIMGTPADGVISVHSSLVAAVQRHLNTEGAGLAVDGLGWSLVQDGHSHTRTISALQRYLSQPADGVLSLPVSGCVKALQERLNTGRF
jgi:hypothetical protein